MQGCASYVGGGLELRRGSPFIVMLKIVGIQILGTVPSIQSEKNYRSSRETL